ncbi:hypothetical protein, conserved [Entamoeba dispar SAW760]|uniref:Exoribonuclease phosphorolytic domain-containing protein n=1 Tax=Entamoeba dispar (strain ATCC PRA-260 / SAW760) TaxID=370354 RepID=B0EV69_ENTDS|nr:uncharacterized protein EDI_284940 [Entamoeba dispar SAW760]EDR21576.1 hypothetical protein, conserved [Entamoeba dispar SAW760]|eukprot:EDR21576.1 hypothetical protein, conserved [Entamoeba dispar SAW760]
MEEDKRTIIESGKIRSISYVRDVSSKSDGCYMFKQGKSCIISGVNAPRDCPKREANPDRAVVKVEVYERCSSFDSQRRTELEEFIKSGVEWTVISEQYPNGLINVCNQIVKDDGSIEAVTMNAAMCALLFSGVDMKGIVVGMCVAGKIDNNGTIEIVIDPDDSISYKWKLFTIWDTIKGEIVAMKMKGKCSDDQLKMSMDISKKNAVKMVKAIKMVIEKQYPH